MRQLLFVVFVGLTVAQLETTYFEPGHQYVYRYETQVVTGVPETSRTFSILKVRTNVRVHLQTRAQFIVKLENVEVRRINGRVEEVDPVNEQVPIEMMEPLYPEELTIMTACLTKEFKFTYNKGNVVDFYVDPTEPHWCVNVKRGVANMFQVNLDQSKSISEPEQSWSSRSFLSTTVNSYRVMETTPAGECETLYEIHEAPTVASTTPLIQVTKVRNYKNCVQRPVFFINSVVGKKCVDCKPETVEPLTSTAHARIIISGDRTKFAILSVVLESKHIFAPHADHKSYAVTIVNQTLELIETPTSVSVMQEPPTLIPQSLIAVIPELAREIQEIESRGVWQDEDMSDVTVTTKKVETAKAVLLELVAVMTTEQTPLTFDTTWMVNTLVEIVRNMTKTEIEKLYSECTMPSAAVPAATVKLTLLRILPMAATPAAVEVVVTAIHTQEVPVSVAVEILTTCALHVYSPTAINKLLVLENCPYTTQSTMFKRSFYLAIGSCVHKMRTMFTTKEREISEGLDKIEKLQKVAMHPQHMQRKLILTAVLRSIETTREQIERTFLAAVEKVLESTSEVDKLIAIKCLGNSGLKNVVTLLKPIITTPTTPKLIRMQAIHTLERAAKTYPYLVIETLLPVYLDTKICEELRITAYHVIASCEPPYHVWEVMAQALKNETNVHVGAFVYRHMMAYSNTTYPCFAAVAKNVTLALAWVKPINDPACRVLHFPIYSTELKTGLSVDVKIIGSPSSLIPRSASVKLQAYKLGYNVEPIEAGYMSEGLESILDKFTGPGSILKNAAENPYLRQLKEELKIKNRFVPSETTGFMYLKVLGNEISFYELQPENIFSLFTTGITVNRVMPSLLANIKMITPTECGLPLVADLKTTSVVKVTGTIQTNLPQIFTASQITANINVKPWISVQTVGKLAVDATIFEVGVTSRNPVYVNQVEVVSTINLDLTTKKFTSTLNMPQTEKILVKHEVVCETFFTMNPVYSTKTFPVPELRPLIASDNSRITQVKFTVPTKFLGSKITLVGEAPTCVMCASPLQVFPLNGHMIGYVKYTPVKPVTKLELCGVVVNDPTSLPVSYPSSAPADFIDLSSSRPTIGSLIQKLRPEILAESTKYGVTVTLMAVTTQERKPLIQVENVCQWTIVSNKKMHCTTMVTRAPLLPTETQPLKAILKVNMEFPMETVTFKTLFTPEYQTGLKELMRQTFVNLDGLSTDTVDWLKVQRIAIWERWVKNFTYVASSMLHEYIPQMQTPFTPRSVLAPAISEIAVAANDIVKEQQRISSLLQELSSESFSSSSSWLPYSSQSSRIAQIIQTAMSRLRVVTAKLQFIKPRLPMLISLQNDKITLMRIMSKLQYAIKQQLLILGKYQFSRIASLKATYPSIISIQQECISQKPILEEIQQILMQHQQRTWWVSNILNQNVAVKHQQLDAILIGTPFASDLSTIFKKQIECARIIHTLLRTSRTTPIPPQTIIQKLTEIFQLFDVIEQSILALVPPTTQMESTSEEAIKALPLSAQWKTACALMALPQQEMILNDIKALVMMLVMRADAPRTEIYRFVEIKQNKLFKTLELTAKLHEVVEIFTRTVVWKMSPEKLVIPSHPNTFSMDVTLHFGEGTPTNVVTAKVVGTKSVEQIWWERQQTRLPNRDPIVTKILTVVPEGSSEYLNLVNLVEEELNTMRSIRVSVKYPTTPEIRPQYPYLCTALDVTLNYIKYLAFWRMTASVPLPSEVNPGIMNVWTNIRKTGRSFDVLLVRPTEAIKIKAIPAPFFIKYGLPTRSFHIRAPASFGMCSIESNIVKTFDGQTFTIPSRLSPMCEKAVVVDCSDRDALAITVRQEPQTLKTIAKIILNRHIIEIIPSAIAPIVKIDGRIIALQESVMLRQPITYFGSEKIELMKQRDVVVLTVPSIGLVIKCVADNIIIQPSRYFHTRLCGLCGNFDSDIRSEYVDPSLFVHQQPQSFAVSYLRPSAQCPVSQYRSLYQPLISACNPSLKHDIISLGMRTCISNIPVRSCTTPCTASNTVPKLIRYFCAPANLQSTRDLVARSRIQQIHSLQVKEFHYSKTIYEPSVCKPQL